MVKNMCCSCDSPIDGSHPKYCRYCFADYMRRRRRRDEDARQKELARAKATKYLKKGILIKQNCSLCGSEDSEMHHPDYSKPLDVSWLCRACHLDFHVLERKILCAS